MGRDGGKGGGGGRDGVMALAQHEIFSLLDPGTMWKARLVVASSWRKTRALVCSRVQSSNYSAVRGAAARQQVRPRYVYLSLIDHYIISYKL